MYHKNQERCSQIPPSPFHSSTSLYIVSQAQIQGWCDICLTLWPGLLPTLKLSGCPPFPIPPPCSNQIVLPGFATWLCIRVWPLLRDPDGLVFLRLVQSHTSPIRKLFWLFFYLLWCFCQKHILTVMAVFIQISNHKISGALTDW